MYDVYDPVTWLGKLTCLSAAMMGLLLTSFIIGIVSQSLLPSRFEEQALNCIGVERARERERELAARLIQFTWRNHRHERELAEKLERRNPRLYAEISAVEEKEFMEEFLTRGKLLRNARRERVELEEQLMGRGKLSVLDRDGGREGRGADDGEGGAAVAIGRRDAADGEALLRELRRLAEQSDEMLRCLRLLLNEREKRRGRRDRERQKRKKKEEEEQNGSLELKDGQGEGGQQEGQQRREDELQAAAGSGRGEAENRWQAKRSRKSERRGRGEADDAVLGVVEESGAVRPARRRSVSYSELRGPGEVGRRSGRGGGGRQGGAGATGGQRGSGGREGRGPRRSRTTS